MCKSASLLFNECQYSYHSMAEVCWQAGKVHDTPVLRCQHTILLFSIWMDDDTFPHHSTNSNFEDNDNLFINNNTSLDITHDLFQLKDAQNLTSCTMHTKRKRFPVHFFSVGPKTNKTHDTCKNKKLVSQKWTSVWESCQFL